MNKILESKDKNNGENYTIRSFTTFIKTKTNLQSVTHNIFFTGINSYMFRLIRQPSSGCTRTKIRSRILLLQFCLGQILASQS